jgi:hypothetical protein
MADQFFDRFQAAVEDPAPADAPDTDAPEEEGKKKGWLRRLIG